MTELTLSSARSLARQRCLNPSCLELVDASVTKPNTYCAGDACRRAAARSRHELAELLVNLMDTDPGDAARRLDEGLGELRRDVTFRLRELLLLSTDDVERWAREAEDERRKMLPARPRASTLAAARRRSSGAVSEA